MCKEEQAQGALRVKEVTNLTRQYNRLLFAYLLAVRQLNQLYKHLAQSRVCAVRPVDPFISEIATHRVRFVTHSKHKSSLWICRYHPENMMLIHFLIGTL